ncbi:unnamed protein product [Rotaria sordida]|uniref:Myotubularin phosphatase domain-containing protein n=1 Tax=Rotaria sordida TaxID=392033 RepID=A0A819M033_9BILA|nr:unnamed protein product [Rotaria sordida]
MAEFRDLSPCRSISTNDIINLLRISAQQQYNAKERCEMNIIVEQNARVLFEQDYICEIILNTNGELSLSYPCNISVPVVDKWSKVQTSKIQSSVNIRDLFVRSRIARCRSRFVAPVIFVDGKYICRSSTLSSWAEIYSRSSMDRFIGTRNQSVVNPSTIDRTLTIDNDDSFDNVEQPEQRTIYDELRGADIDLLKIFDVGSIVNLMVQKKYTLFGMKLTGSEKFDKYNRYGSFEMILLPYPGCEHFRELVTVKYNAELMFYKWSLPKNDAIPEIPIHLSSCLYTDWSFWRTWNSVELTKNYLQIILHQLETNKCGILIHCLSGWDRTPLFISLLRLSLWADGCIHQSLTVEEILYLTLAYDWYLFGHNLSERLKFDEEILYFTFIMLPHLVENEFVFQPSNITNRQSILVATEPNSHCSSGYHCIYPDIGKDSTKKTIRKEKLLAVSNLFHVCYLTVVPNDSNKLDPQRLGLHVARSIKNFFIR